MQTQRSTNRQVDNKLISIHMSASGTIIVPGASGVSSIAIDGETVTSAEIIQVWWGVRANLTGASWEIKRNNEVVLVLPHSGHLFFGLDHPLALNDTHNIALTLHGSAGFVVLELKKG